VRTGSCCAPPARAPTRSRRRRTTSPAAGPRARACAGWRQGWDTWGRSSPRSCRTTPAPSAPRSSPAASRRTTRSPSWPGRTSARRVTSTRWPWPRARCSAADRRRLLRRRRSPGRARAAGPVLRCRPHAPPRVPRRGDGVGDPPRRLPGGEPGGDQAVARPGSRRPRLAAVRPLHAAVRGRAPPDGAAGHGAGGTHPRQDHPARAAGRPGAGPRARALRDRHQRTARSRRRPAARPGSPSCATWSTAWDRAGSSSPRRCGAPAGTSSVARPSPAPTSPRSTSARCWGRSSRGAGWSRSGT
jgi:hypothetical protein